MEKSENYRVTSILAAYQATVQRILFLCFNGGDIKEVEREAISVTDFALAVNAAQSDGEIEILVARRDAI